MPQPIYFREFGSGPAVLLLHGQLSPRDHFMPLVEALDTSHRVLLPDFPGYGRSPALPAGWTFDDAFAALEEGVLARGVKQVKVVGFSCGAYLALGLAVRKKLEVTRIVALGGLASLSPEERAGMQGFAAALKAGVDLREAAVARFLAPAFAKANPGVADQVRGWLNTIATKDLLNELGAMAALPDLLPALKGVRVPLTARVGDQDAACPPAKSRELAACIPGSVVEVVPGAGHALLYEDVAATAASVRRALGG
ncbi:MAG: alpha/beta fold hydrolase [Myxococcaceae bacterium]